MKKLKFRLWDHRVNKFVYPRVIVFDNILDYELSLDIPDMNGKEIFAGDLYRTGASKEVYQVFYKHGVLCGGKTFENATPLTWDYDDCTGLVVPDYKWISEYVHVVGNIHEGIK